MGVQTIAYSEELIAESMVNALTLSENARMENVSAAKVAFVAIAKPHWPNIGMPVVIAVPFRLRITLLAEANAVTTLTVATPLVFASTMPASATPTSFALIAI